MWDQSVDHDQVFFRRQTLCETLAGNPVPVLTITQRPKTDSRESIEEFSELLIGHLIENWKQS